MALLSLDARLSGLFRSRREPLAVQLRLGWWRDTLEKPASDWPLGEPILDSLRNWRDARCLAQLVEGWEALLSETLTPTVIAEFVDGRGMAFACLARELGFKAEDDAQRAGRIWAAADLAANVSDGREKTLVVEYGSTLVPPSLSASLRPLAVLAGLGAAALSKGGAPLLQGPRSLLLALRIGLAGR